MLEIILIKRKKSQCWLVTAAEIKNWDERKTYDNSFEEVKLFHYPKTGKIVGVEEVAGFIRDTISLILSENYSDTSMKRLSGYEEIVYGNLCQFLDRKIAWIHQKHAKMKTSDYSRLDYRIDFKEFVSIIHQIDDKIRDQNEFYLKEKCYKSAAHLWQEGFQNCCENCDMYNDDIICDRDCAAKEALDLYLSHGDPEAFWKLLCPDEIEWTGSMCILERMEKSQLSAKLLEPISLAKDSSKVMLQENHFILDAEEALEKAMNQDFIPMDHSSKNTIIPTLLNLSDRKNEAIGKKLDRLYKNRSARNVFAGSVITAQEENGNISIGRWSHQQINEVWEGRTNRIAKLSGDTINPGHKTFRILSIETLKCKMEEERE